MQLFEKYDQVLTTKLYHYIKKETV